MKSIALIPARLAATRFPRKPLALLRGLPMIEHVRRRTLLCPLLSDVVVATCDPEIKETVEAYGGKVVMTSPAHERCTDRIAEAAASLKADIVVNVQGDEPLLNPAMLDDVLSPLQADAELQCSNLMMAIESEADFQSPNVVKVVVDNKGNLLYASRCAIPGSLGKPTELLLRQKQLGIIAFRAGFLQQFSKLSPTPLEKSESVDMLRAVEHGFKVKMVATKHRTIVGVDTMEDLQKAELLLAQDPLVARYL